MRIQVARSKLAAGCLALLVSTAGCKATIEVEGSVDHGVGDDGGADAGGADAGGDASGGATQDGYRSIEAPICAEVTVELSRTIPTVVLLIDQSTSMTSDFGGVSRWQAVYQTLMSSSGGTVKELQGSVRFGLALYTSHNGRAGGICPILTEVPAALNNYSAIDAVYKPAQPEMDTPTGEAIDAVAAELKAMSEPGPKAIALATDGEPDTCATPNPQDGQPQAVAAAQRAQASGIRSFIISVGDEVSVQHLQDMANAGRGLPVGGPQNAPFYRALQPSELATAFREIMSAVQDCRFTLKGTVDTRYASQGTVTMDGKPLAFGKDWRLLDAHTLEILNSACESLNTGESHALRATFPCVAVIE